MTKNKRLTTGAGIALYPYLFTPDTKYSSDGVYSVTLRMTKATEKSLKKDLEKLHKETLELYKEQTGKEPTKVNPVPVRDEIDIEGEPVLDFKFKMKPSFKGKDGSVVEQRPAVFDAALVPMTADSKLGHGSKVKVNFAVASYATHMGVGVTLRLNAVQVLDLVTWEGGEDSAFEVEEGFTAPAPKAETPAVTTNKQGSTEAVVADAAGF
jgi:hypothetical protein